MKTEKEKMLAGEVYDCADNELLTRWHKAKQLQQEYNNTLTTDAGKISDLLDELIGSRGDNVWISAPFFVDYGENIYIGKNVEINMNCVFLDCNKSKYKDLFPKIKNILVSGGVLFADNVFYRGYVTGEVKAPHRQNTIKKNMREFLRLITSDEDFITTLSDIGDGISVSYKK